MTDELSTRVDHDAYETRDDCALAICGYLKPYLPGVASSYILEPSAGHGAFVKAVRKTWPGVSVVALEVRVECEETLMQLTDGHTAIRDFLLCPVPRISPSLIPGNPPYGEAEAHIDKAMTVLGEGGWLVQLLKVGFIAGKGRWERLYSKWPLRYYLPLIPRPGFCYPGNEDGSETDQSEYAVFVWNKGYQGNAEILPALNWKEYRNADLP